MFRRGGRMFAGRGISLPGFVVSAVVIAIAFGLGIAAGWFTASLPDMLAAEPSPSPTPTPSSILDSAPAPSLPPLPPITRTLTQEDRDAGVVAIDVPTRGDGTFTVVPGGGEPDPAGGDVRYVAVSIEDGLRVDAAAFRTYVLDVLNDNRGWGTADSVQYVATDGVADYTVVLASPYTTAALCPQSHDVVESGPVVPVSPSAVPSTAPTPTPDAGPGTVDLCHDGGKIVLSLYDWTAGKPGYGDDVAGSRRYLLLHRVGHLLGKPDVECVPPVADAMVNQDEALPEGCAPNPWPYPDAPADEPSASPTPSATPGV